MAGSINKVILVGHLGKDPELKYTPTGQPVTKFSMATSKQWKDRAGQKQEKTTWHDIVVWGKTAEIVGKYAAKGSLVYVEGEIDKRQYEARDGGKRTAFEIVAQSVQFLSKSGRAEGAEPAGGGRPATSDDPIIDEDIPF